jgi:hypothetical protein
MGRGTSGLSYVGAVNSALTSGVASSGHAGAISAPSSENFASRVASLSSHAPGSSTPLPLEAAAGLLLVGGVALGPALRRRKGKPGRRIAGAHFPRSA